MKRQGFSGTSKSFSSTITENGHLPSELTEEDFDSLQFELAKTEEEILTLRQVLLAKERYASDIRRQLGMSPLSSIKQNLSKGWQEVQTSAPYLTAAATLEDISHSNVYMRTRESLVNAGQVTSTALSHMGVTVTRRLAEMSMLNHPISVPTMRHSSTFKSFEEMVGNVKDKVTGSLANNGDASGSERSSLHRT